MFSSTRYAVYLLSLAGYFGSHHYGLTEAAQVISTTAITTSSRVQIKTTKTVGLEEDIALKKVAAKFETEAVDSIPNVSTVQIASLVLPASASKEDVWQPKATKQGLALQAKTILPSTLDVYSFASVHVMTSTTVLSRSGSGLVQSSRVHNLTSIFQSNSSSDSHAREGIDDNDDCSTGKGGKKCDTYVTRWVDFYVNVSIAV